MRNFYQDLGLSASAESEHIKAAFHRLAKGSHPDVNSSDATAEKRFKEVNQAYEILSDPERRAAYDLGLLHKHAETRRRVRNAVVATAASFMITVGCGLYLSLSDVGKFAGRQASTARPSYRRPTQQPKQHRPHQSAEGGTKAFSDPANLPPDPQARRERAPHSTAEPLRQEEPATARPAEERVAVMESPPPSPPVPQTRPVQPNTGPPGTEMRRPATNTGVREGTLIADAMQGPPPSAPDAQAQRTYARHLLAKGMEHIQHGNVVAARMFFTKAAQAGSVAGMRALAGTYDPVQLDKLKVIGMQPDVDAARQWYERAGDGVAVATTERDVRKNGELNFATDKAAADLPQFRAAYISGDGLTYLVMSDEKGQHIYRYGDVSRLAAKRDKHAYTLFTCDTAHVFSPEKPEDLAALLKATVVTH
jgi:DnaJ domain